MKKLSKYAALMLCVLAVASCSKNKFNVNGEITQAKDSVLYFENMSLDGPVVMDSVKLSDDGKFAFSGDGVTSPEFYRLRIANQIINLSIDSTETVTFKAQYPTMASQYEVTGSENCSKIKELALMQMGLLGQAMAIDRNPSLGVQQSSDSIAKIVEKYKENVKANYIFKEPYKAYAYFALFQALGNTLIFNPRETNEDVQVFAAVATSWDTYYPDAERGLNLHNIAIEGIKAQRILMARQNGPLIDASKVQVANIIDVPLLDSKGKKHSLTELAGKVVLLDFHAFSSEHSTERIMLLRELYNKYHAKGFEIYQVGLDPNEHFWKTQTSLLPWINVYDPDGPQSAYLARYNVQSIPTFFLIDKTNTLYKRDAQIEDIDKEIQSLL